MERWSTGQTSQIWDKWQNVEMDRGISEGQESQMLSEGAVWVILLHIGWTPARLSVFSNTVDNLSSGHL